MRAAWAIVAVFTLLTNAYFFRFLEPLVSRGAVSAAFLGIWATALLVMARGLPPLRRLALPLALTLVLALAYALRDWGARGGLPVSYIPDEYGHVTTALMMLKTGDFNPHNWYYPGLQRYLTTATYLVTFFAQVPAGRWQSISQVNVQDMLYWGRWVSVVAGTATVFVTFLVGRRLLGSREGIVAALLVAVFPGAVRYSQYNKPDAVMAFMATLTILVVLLYFERGGLPLALACGVVCGLTIASKYSGAVVVLPLVVAAWLRHGEKTLVRADLYVAGFATVLSFLMACPFLLAEFPKFVDQFARELYTYGYTGQRGSSGTDNWFNHFRYMWLQGTGPVALLLGITGLVLFLCALDPVRVVFLSLPVVYFAFYSTQRVNWSDNLMPLYPYLAVLAAHALATVARSLRPARFPLAGPLAAAGLLAWSVAIPAATTARLNRNATAPDTGNEARRWIEGRLPRGTAFVAEALGPVPDQRRFKVVVESYATNRSLGQWREEGIEYLLVTSDGYGRVNPDHPRGRAYAQLFERCPLVMEWSRRAGVVEGPTIRLLKVPEGD